MQWSDAAPNLVIGLREGLEMGLVITILLAAIKQLSPHDQAQSKARPLWIGVWGALGLAMSFSAILTFTTADLSGRALETVGGILSLIAVGLVTAMIFWMRSTAHTLSAHLRGEVAKAMTLGAGALALTAFAAVAREGLETALFMWTAIRATGDTLAPMLGAGTGLLIALILCMLLYRRSIHFNLSAFFNRTAVLLIIVAAGILAYGIGDLQEARLLPGHSWTAFDLSNRISAGSWWVALVGGLTNLAPRMTVLQVTGWAVYLIIFLVSFSRTTTSLVTPRNAEEQPELKPSPIMVTMSRRPRVAAAILLSGPAIIATLIILALPSSSGKNVTVTATSCAQDWNAAEVGERTFAVTNKAKVSGEILLIDSAGGVVGELETLAPGTTANLTANFRKGTYHFQCLLSDGSQRVSSQITATGTDADAPIAVKPASETELKPANDAYVGYVTRQLSVLTKDAQALRSGLASGDRDQAKEAWLKAQLAWEKVGASYNSFGESGIAISGLPGGLRLGAKDSAFTGLHRIEYGLFHGESPSALVTLSDRLITDIASLRKQITKIAADPTDLTLRAHEILEDSQRDHVSGIDDQGGHAAYAMTVANLDVTRTVWGLLEPMIETRNTKLIGEADAAFDRLADALNAVHVDGRWLGPSEATVKQRAKINAALGAALEITARVPGLLEVPSQAINTAPTTSHGAAK